MATMSSLDDLTASPHPTERAHQSSRPTREEAHHTFHEVIREIERSRGSRQFENDFHLQIADAVFDACWSALVHFSAHVEQRGDAKKSTHGELREIVQGKMPNTTPPRLHVVSAPMGTGKTTFTIAFIVTMTRMSQRYAHMPQGCVYLTDQIVKADTMYRELVRFLPNQVAIWTSDHDKSCTEPRRVRNPIARFSKGELANYPVAIATHALFQSAGSDEARVVVRDGEMAPRALTLVDEQMEDVITHSTSLAATAKVMEFLHDEGASDVIPHVDTLIGFMAAKVASGSKLEKPEDDRASWSVVEKLDWFTTKEATWFAQSNKGRIPDIEAVFGFAQAMVRDYAFIVSGAGGPRFIGCEPRHAIVPGMVLLDATADLDGVTQLCPWRVHSQVPHARYDDLEVVHVLPCTEQRLNEYFREAENRTTYADWMKEVIQEQLQPGQHGLVVCKKTLIDKRNIPDWPDIDARWSDVLGEEADKPYTWTLEGRLLAVTYWGGAGVGSNRWQNADVVFLFDEHFLPTGAFIGRTQGLLLAPTKSGPVANMSTTNTKSDEVTRISEGHLLRWTKQMGMRGCARRFNAQGMCGKQKIVVTGDYERLLLNVGLLFPGSKLSPSRPDYDLSRYTTRRRKLLEFLSDPKLPPVVPVSRVGEAIGVTWRDVSSSLISDETRKMFAALGWTYVSQRGSRGSSFQRLPRGNLSRNAEISQ
jgi:hypothetical protein